MFEFRVLGGVTLAGEDGPLSGKPVQARRIALLALLASHPHRTLTRDKLMALLWPESDAEQGRHRLSESLYVLRKALGEESLVSVGDQVRLDTSRIVCDVVAFREAVEEGALERAVSLYAGPFLDGFFLKDAEEFDGWVESERQGLAGDYARALEALAAEADGNGDPILAVGWWSRLAAHDPYNSRYSLGLMQALARSGDPGNALYHAQEHARFLKEELGAEPTPEVLAFAESLRNGEANAGVNGGEKGGVNGGLRGQVLGGRVGDGEGPLRQTVSPGPTPPFVAPLPAPRPFPWRTWAVGVAILIPLLWAGASFLPLNGGGGPELSPGLVVIPPFENRSADPAFQDAGVLVAEWTEEVIQQVEGVQVVPSSFTRQYAEDAVGNGRPNAVQSVAVRAGAAWAVGGVIQDRGDSLELRAEIIDVGHRRKSQAVVEVANKDELNESLDRFARRVAGALAYEFDPWMGEMEGDAQPLPAPPTIEAFREHRLGYEAYNRQDYGSSFQHHMAAFSLDTTLVRALVAAAFMSGDSHVGDSLGQYANERRHLLSRRGRLDLDILLSMGRNDIQGALRAIREMARLEGGGFNSVVLAWFALRANLPREVIESTARYDPTLEWRRDEAHRYWARRADAWHMLGEFERALDEARRGRERYPERLDLLTAEAQALAGLGRVQEVPDLLNQARALSGDPASAALIVGMELRAHGFPEESRDAFNRAVEWLTSGSNGEPRDSAAGFELAEALYGAERWEEAQKLAVALLEAYPGELSARALVGLAGARLGDTGLATESMDRLPGMSRPNRPGMHLYLMASIAAVLGRGDEAMRLLYQAYDEGFPHSLAVHRDMNLESLRDREDFRALMAPKG